jgi:hypothetical protein
MNLSCRFVTTNCNIANNWEQLQPHEETKTPASMHAATKAAQNSNISQPQHRNTLLPPLNLSHGVVDELGVSEVL